MSFSGATAAVVMLPMSPLACERRLPAPTSLELAGKRRKPWFCALVSELLVIACSSWSSFRSTPHIVPATESIFLGKVLGFKCEFCDFLIIKNIKIMRTMQSVS